MGIWAEIKHAINSTLGTSDFKPLNEIVMQTKDLAASDTIYKVIYPTGTTSIPTFNFIAKRDGSIRVLLLVTSNNSSSYTNTHTITVKYNNETVASISEIITTRGEGKTIKLDVPITKNNTYSVSVSTSGSGASKTDGLMIGAVELDITGIEILE